MAVERTLSIIKPDAVAAQSSSAKSIRASRPTDSRSSPRRCAGCRCAEAERFLRGSPRTAVFQGSGRFHDVGPGDDPGARGRKRDREEPRPHGRHRSEKGRARHDPRRFRANRSTPTPSTAPTARKPRRRRSRYFFPALWRSTQSRSRSHGLDGDARDQPARSRRRGPRGSFRRTRREAVSREAGVALGAPAARRRHRAMTDLSRALREKLAARRGNPRPDGDRRHHGRRRHAQVAARRRRRQRRRDGLHSRGRPRHAVHFVAGGLRARLRVLLDRQAGLQSQSHDRRDRRPAVAREPRAARRWRSARPGSSRAARRSPTS